MRLIFIFSLAAIDNLMGLRKRAMATHVSQQRLTDLRTRMNTVFSLIHSSICTCFVSYCDSWGSYSYASHTNKRQSPGFVGHDCVAFVRIRGGFLFLCLSNMAVIENAAPRTRIGIIFFLLHNNMIHSLPAYAFSCLTRKNITSKLHGHQVPLSP